VAHPPPRNRRTRLPAAADYSLDSLQRLANILVLSGHSPSQLERTFRQICRRLKPATRRFDPLQPAFLADLPHVLSLWHSEPEYLNAEGRPAVLLPSSRRGVSLGELIHRVLPGEPPTRVIRALLDTRGIQRAGKGYRPTGRHLSYREDSGSVYGLNTLNRMLRTVEHNLSGSRKQAIFERSAVHPDFPVQALKTYQRRFKARAANFLWEEDEQLRRFADEVSGTERTRAGVVVFTFIDPVSEKPARGACKRPAGSRVRKGTHR
jgi:hypothetical protein